MKKIALVLSLAFLLSTITLGSQVVNLSNAQTSIEIIIKEDGNIEGTNKIQRNENVYTFTGNISGNIQVQKSKIVMREHR